MLSACAKIHGTQADQYSDCTKEGRRDTIYLATKRNVYPIVKDEICM